LSLISDKFTPKVTRETFTPLGYSRRMKYTMSTKELARLTVIKGAIDGVYTVKQAARKLGMSMRWVKHLKQAVREQGDGAVILGNSFKPTPRRLTGLGRAFNTPYTGFRMTRQGIFWPGTSVNTSAFRGILRHFGWSYRTMERQKPSSPTESAYISSTPKNRRTGRLRNNRPERPWIKPNSVIVPKPWAAIVFPLEAHKPKGVLNACGRREQSRLPVWFTIQGIHAMKQVNAVLPRFITEFNPRFHRNPACRNEKCYK
jgi:transposase